MKKWLIFFILTACCLPLTACNSNVQPLIKKVNADQHKALSVQKEPVKTVSMEIDQNEYHFQYNSELTKNNIIATMTARGIVWVPGIEMLETSSDLDKIPMEPYRIYLNKNVDSTISVQNSEYIYSFPLKDSKDNYFFLNSLYGIGNHVIIPTFLRMKGVPQATICKLYDLNLDSKK